MINDQPLTLWFSRLSPGRRKIGPENIAVEIQPIFMPNWLLNKVCRCRIHLHSDVYNYITYRYFLFGFWTMGHPLQIIRVIKVTGNLNFLWWSNTPYSKMLAIIGPVCREVEDFGRWGNQLRWDNPPVHVISHFNLNQEPISWNEQLPRRFHGPVYFQNGFGANLEHL